jgi:hypothetical protein
VHLCGAAAPALCRPTLLHSTAEAVRSVRSSLHPVWGRPDSPATEPPAHYNNRPGAAACLTIVRQAVHALRKANAPKAAVQPESNEPSGGAGGVRAWHSLQLARIIDRLGPQRACLPGHRRRCCPVGTRSTHSGVLGVLMGTGWGYSAHACPGTAGAGALLSSVSSAGASGFSRHHSATVATVHMIACTALWPRQAIGPMHATVATFCRYPRPWCSPRR